MKIKGNDVLYISDNKKVCVTFSLWDMGAKYKVLVNNSGYWEFYGAYTTQGVAQNNAQLIESKGINNFAKNVVTININ